MITVPENMLVQIEARLAAGEYASVEDLLQHAFDALDRQRAAYACVDEKLQEALAEGQSAEMTAQEWADIRREGLEEIRRRRES